MCAESVLARHLFIPMKTLKFKYYACKFCNCLHEISEIEKRRVDQLGTPTPGVPIESISAKNAIICNMICF